MTTVYIPNAPLRKDPVTGEFVLSMNLGRARRFGDLVYLFSRDEIGDGSAIDLKALELAVDERMCALVDSDYILFVGDPTVMAMVVRAHARLLPGARMNLLRWDRFHRDYMEVSLK